MENDVTGYGICSVVLLTRYHHLVARKHRTIEVPVQILRCSILVTTDM